MSSIAALIGVVCACSLAVSLLTVLSPNGMTNKVLSIVTGAFILCGDGWDFSVMFKVPSIGDIFSIIAGVLYGVNIAFTQVFAKDKNPIVYVSIQMAVLTLISFIYSFAFERPLLFSWDIKNILIVFFLAIFCTAICWIVRTFAVKNISAITIGVMNPMSAVVATTIALSLGQEQFTYNLLVGALIIIAAILISAISQAVKEEKEKANSLGREE